MVSDSDPRILSKLTDVLLDYKKTFEKVYDQAVSATSDVLPSQSSNEIRNFVGHLADAVYAKDVAHAELEFVRATRHLRFATYDAAAVMLIYREAYVISYVRNIEIKHGKMPELEERLDRLSSTRRAIPLISFDPDVIDGSPEAAANAANDAALATERANKAVTLYNNFARELELKFPAEQPHNVTPQASITEVHRQEGLVQRLGALKAIWTYAGSLAAILAIGEMATIRSFQLLLPIGAVCLAGGLIGTFLAVTAPAGEMSDQPSKRDRA